MPAPETDHMETEALLAVMRDDPKRLFDILNDLSVDEVRMFHRQVAALGEALLERLPRRAPYQPRHQRSTVPEDYSFHDHGPVVRASDTGWEPGERDW